MADSADEHRHTLWAAALASAAEELQGIERDIEQLQRQVQALLNRAAPLREFIRLGTLLLGEEPAPPLSTPPERDGTRLPLTRPRPLPRRVPAREYAQQVLAAVGRPLRAQEIADYLAERGLMRGKWTREVLRTAMRKDQEIFECLGAGVYTLKGLRRDGE